MDERMKEKPYKKVVSGYFWTHVWSSMGKGDHSPAFYPAYYLAVKAEVLSSSVSNLATANRIRTES